MKPLPFESHDAEFVLAQFELVLAEYKINDSNSISIISDQGPNMVGCLGLTSKYSREDCYCHLLATVIKRVLFKVKRQRDGRSTSVYKYIEQAPSVFKLIDAAFKLCEHLKRTHCNKDLPQTTKKAFEVRWSSLYTMLNSIHSVYKEIKHLCTINNTLHWLQGIDADLLKEMVSLLEPFKEVTEILEKYKEPTIHQIIYCRNGIVEHLKQEQTDSVAIKAIKECLMEELNFKWPIKPLHVAAAILDPFQKRVLISKMGCSQEQIEEGKQYLKEVISKVPHERGECNLVTLQPRKKYKISKSMDSLFEDEESLSFEEKVNRELESYDNFSLSNESRKTHQVLTFWESMKDKLKYLSLAAKFILSIPASSSKCECDFSIAGRTKPKTRSSLNPESLEALVLIKDNLDLISDS